MTSAADKAVLNAIFNPLFPCLDDEDVVETEEQSKNGENSSKDSRIEDKNVTRLEAAGVKAAEEEKFDDAVRLFTEAITLNPNRASCYNNRAQALRLKNDIEGAKTDLNQAIALSNGTGKTACQAFTQRAMIARLESREEDARADFEAAAKLGSQFAKTQLVLMNPYAALCGKMLSDMVRKVQTGEVDG